ncbi:hypothetical protein SLEP1_g51497 [Rubroshorea leprosula]|uniref:Protein kinase domain-containing protein n=1 Tax=Rubroshorea leprosula TaxID=152421 RepID=A0AAV5M3G1_9ROSI|nr:hypothetical protein SLEP1_g51497 [Rubroshorea leprosula]
MEKQVLEELPFMGSNAAQFQISRNPMWLLDTGRATTALLNLSTVPSSQSQQPTSKKRAGTKQCAFDALAGGGGVALAEGLLGIGPSPNTFNYAELRAATDNFSPSNKLGEGGFGPVYKGKLSDGRVVAVKRLLVASHQGKSQFVTEVATISVVQRRNLVQLYGCCIEGDRRLLVYEYLENKSLDQALFEYAMRGHLTKKADVFGFGVVALEITMYENNQCLGLVDPTLVEFDDNEALRMIRVGLLCTQASPTMRPPMSRVIAMLVGDIEVSPVTSKPSYLIDWDFEDITASIKAENTPSTRAQYRKVNTKKLASIFATDSKSILIVEIAPHDSNPQSHNSTSESFNSAFFPDQQPTSKKRASTKQCASDALAGGGGVALAEGGLVELWLPSSVALYGAKG